MSEEQAESPKLSGGMASLSVAQAHLSTLLGATEAMDGKASLLLAVNAAFFGVFFGALASLDERSWWAVAPPGAVFGLILTLGWLTMRPRRLSQFVHPSVLLSYGDRGFSDQELAWSHVSSIRDSCVAALEILDQKSMGVQGLALLSLAHIVAIAVSTAVWLA